MYKKNKQSMVSDFRSQITGLQDSPFTRETTSSMELDLCHSDKLVIDFSRENAKEASYKSKFAIDKTLENVGVSMRGEQGNVKQSAALYAFEEHAHVYFCDLDGTAYHTSKELAMLNNRLNVSLLRFDFDNRIHHFRNLKKLYHRSSDLYTCSGFFEHRFDNLMILTTLNSKVLIEDFECNKSLLEVKHRDVSFVQAWDELYGLFDSQGCLSLFDIRDHACPVRSISCNSQKKGSANGLRCLGAKKRGHRLLVSTNRETFTVDLRKSSLLEECRSPIYNGKRNSLTYLEEKPTEINRQLSSVNCTKSHFIDDNRAVIMDFVERTLDLHEFSDCSIQKSLSFSRQLYDIGFSETLGKIGVLLENQQGNREVAVFNSDLSLYDVYSLGGGRYTKLGFLGSEGKLLVHSRNDYVVLDIDQRPDLDDF